MEQALHSASEGSGQTADAQAHEADQSLELANIKIVGNAVHWLKFLHR